MLMALGNLIKGVASLAIVGLLGVAGFFGYQEYEKYVNSGKTIAEQKQKIEKLTIEKQKLALANRLLKVDSLLAHLKMVRSYRDPKTREKISRVEFWEVDQQGNPVGEAQEFIIHGGEDNIVHVEGLVAKFDDALIEKGDPLRGHAMFLFKRIYGENTEPANGHSLYAKRTQPTAYERGGRPTPFEKQMWEQVWETAHDPKAMEKLGLRDLGGQAGIMSLREGHTYEVRLRATGDISIRPLSPEDSRRVQPNGGRF